MEDPPLIREATPDQAEAMSELAYRSKSYWGYSAWFMEACKDELSVTAADIDSEGVHYWMAVRGAELLGYYALERCSDTEYELGALFVEPQHIGTGVGRALIDHAKRKVSGMGGEGLIIQGDPHAEGFYLAAGGRRVGSRESGSIAGRQLPLFRIALGDESVA